MNAGELVTCSGGGDPPGLDAIEDGALLAVGGRVAWVGTTKEFRRKGIKVDAVADAHGRLVTPGFVDPHTHLAFAGSREDELERKARGETYSSILRSGGGILRTTRETRRASLRSIAAQSGDRLGQLVRNGVTTVEVKTGYGGDLAGEVKLLRAIRLLGRGGGIDVEATFMGLHATPAGFSAAEYLRYVLGKVLPAISAMQDKPRFSDCFCERGVFTAAECSKYLQASRKAGLALKVHADEFSDSGGASLAAEMGCVSADHLGKSDAEGLREMGKRNVTAVLLPMTSSYSGIGFADAKGIAAAGCTLALGTDLSPNSWVESPQLVMGLACTALRMTPAEALLAFTAGAAKALRRDDVGNLRVGSKADFVIHSLPNHRFLPYRVGGRYVEAVFKEGRRLALNEAS